VAVVELLLATGQVDIDSKSSYDRTPLSWAAKNGHVAVVGLLLRTGVDINSTDSDGNTALQLARSLQFTPIIKILEKAGGR